MDSMVNGFLISDDKRRIQPGRVQELLTVTYWAKGRQMDVVQASIAHSLCVGIYKDDIQVGFARCVTDYATVYWLCDVIIDPAYRGHGLGKALMKYITEHEALRGLLGILGTKDAHGLYMQHGFQPSQSLMRRDVE